jgi:hypothetical protein
MEWQIFFKNRLSQIVETTIKIWEILSSNDVLYTVLIKKEQPNKKIFFAEKKGDLKIVRAFISKDDAQKYCSSNSNQKVTLLVYPMNHDTIYNSIAYIAETGESIECQLTALDSKGNVYNIETIWTKDIN